MDDADLATSAGECRVLAIVTGRVRDRPAERAVAGARRLTTVAATSGVDDQNHHHGAVLLHPSGSEATPSATTGWYVAPRRAASAAVDVPTHGAIASLSGVLMMSEPRVGGGLLLGRRVVGEK